MGPRFKLDETTGLVVDDDDALGFIRMPAPPEKAKGEALVLPSGAGGCCDDEECLLTAGDWEMDRAWMEYSSKGTIRRA